MVVKIHQETSYPYQVIPNTLPYSIKCLKTSSFTVKIFSSHKLNCDTLLTNTDRTVLN